MNLIGIIASKDKIKIGFRCTCGGLLLFIIGNKNKKIYECEKCREIIEETNENP